MHAQCFMVEVVNSIDSIAISCFLTYLHYLFVMQHFVGLCSFPFYDLSWVNRLIQDKTSIHCNFYKQVFYIWKRQNQNFDLYLSHINSYYSDFGFKSSTYIKYRGSLLWKTWKRVNDVHKKIKGEDWMIETNYIWIMLHIFYSFLTCKLTNFHT